MTAFVCVRVRMHVSSKRKGYNILSEKTSRKQQNPPKIRLNMLPKIYLVVLRTCKTITLQLNKSMHPCLRLAIGE